MDSPLAQALLNKHEGDEIQVQGPKGVISHYINKVQYQAFE